jgi:tetratricopeptide (TPR) repeat protein
METMTTLKQDVMALCKRGAHSDAIQLAQKAIEASPGSSEAWHLLAYAHEREKNLELALLAAGKAVELAPVEPALWFHQGWLHLKVDAAEDCLNDMEQTIEKGASFGDTYYQETAQFLAAESLRRLRRYQEALAMCQAVRDDFALYVGKPLSKGELVQSCYRAMTHTSTRLASFAA